MRKLNLESKTKTGKCEIILGESIKNLKNYTKEKREKKERKTIIIIDENVRKIYGNAFSDYDNDIIDIPPGESSKSLEQVKRIYQKLLDLEVDRSCLIVGVGGGVTCDITGFVASTYMRGVEFGFVPTTILAQTDAGIGGKNGVDFERYKNIIGTFNQPRFVICDLEVLKTLPKKEIQCGFAEIVKHAAIANKELFEYIDQNIERALELHRTTIEKIIYESILVKINIVSKDAREHGERKKLNFGHTFGHAVEKVTGMSHGEAISIGMVIAAYLSFRKGMLPKEDADRIRKILEKIGLPTKLNLNTNSNMGLNKKDVDAIFDAIKKDKKRKRESIDFVLLKDIGSAIIVPIEIEELKEVVNNLKKVIYG